MAVAPQGGFGLTVQIDVSATLTTMAGIEDVDFPKLRNFIAETTTHSSTNGYYEAVATGKKRVEPFRMVLFWDTGDTTHAAIVTAFDAGTPTSFTIADPDGDETIAFECIIEEMERMSRQEEAFKCNVLIHPTGAATIS